MAVVQHTLDVHKLVLDSAKRSRDVYLAQYGQPTAEDQKSQKLRLASKIADEYATVVELPQEVLAAQQQGKQGGAGAAAAATGKPASSSLSTALVLKQNDPIKALIQSAAAQSSALATSNMQSVPKPKWHAPWKLMRVISGHLGWVRCVAVEPGNEWFVTGSADKTVKVWDLASGTLKITLTGHISSVRGVAVSERSPYLFSVGDDKLVKCWDLEVNKVIRHYHGHLSGVYTCALHPTLDLLFTGGRDSTVRVWDIRTKNNVHVMTGHTNTVASLAAQAVQPQVISGSMDNTIRLWDLVAGKTQGILTHHKKSVRSLAINPNEYTFASGAPDNIKEWKCPDGTFLQNLSGHNAIVNTIAINSDDVMFSGADNGSMYFWDYKSGYNFQRMDTIVQPGSLDSEMGVFASTFDKSGSRLITCEADKTIKIWREDDSATEETHPIEFKGMLRRSRW